MNRFPNNINESPNLLDLASTAAGIGSLLAKNKAAKIGLGGLAAAGLMSNTMDIDQSSPNYDADALAGARGAAAAGFALAPFLAKKPVAPIGRQNVRIRPFVPVRPKPQIDFVDQRPLLPDQRITDPSRLLPFLAAPTTNLAIRPTAKISALSNIDPRISSFVQRTNKMKGLPRYRPERIVVDPFSQGSSRLSRDLDIPEIGKIGYNPNAKREVEYQLSKNRYWGDVHPGYYDALAKVDPGAARAMEYLGGEQRIKSLFASYEPETLNNVLVESMVHFVKKKNNINEIFGFGGGSGSSWIDTAQDWADYGSAALGLVPGLNLVASGIDTISAGIDAAQGQYGDAAIRGGIAAIGLIPGMGSAGHVAAKAGSIGAKKIGTMAVRQGAKMAASSAPRIARAGEAIGILGLKGEKLGGRYLGKLQANQLRLPEKLGGRGIVSGEQAYGRGYGRKLFQGENPLAANRSGKFGIMSKGLGKAVNYGMLVNLGLAGLAGYQGLQAYRDWKRGNPKEEDINTLLNRHYTTQRPTRKPSNLSGASSAFGINQADEGQSQSASERFRNKF